VRLSEGRQRARGEITDDGGRHDKSNAYQRNKRNGIEFRHKSFAPGRCLVDLHQGAGGLQNIAQGLRAAVRCCIQREPNCTANWDGCG
jgi:hypothetical protein